jgi:hypothetical protein
MATPEAPLLIAYVLNKFKGWLAILGAVIVAMLYAYSRGRRGGITDAHKETQKQTDKVTEKWREIDSRKPDLDGALGKLRDRSRKG